MNKKIDLGVPVVIPSLDTGVRLSLFALNIMFAHFPYISVLVLMFCRFPYLFVFILLFYMYL